MPAPTAAVYKHVNTGRLYLIAGAHRRWITANHDGSVSAAQALAAILWHGAEDRTTWDATKSVCLIESLPDA